MIRLFPGKATRRPSAAGKYLVPETLPFHENEFPLVTAILVYNIQGLKMVPCATPQLKPPMLTIPLQKGHEGRGTKVHKKATRQDVTILPRHPNTEEASPLVTPQLREPSSWG